MNTSSMARYAHLQMTRVSKYSGRPLGTLLLEQAGKRSQKTCMVCGGNFSQAPACNQLLQQTGNGAVSKRQRVYPHASTAPCPLALGASALAGQLAAWVRGHKHGRQRATANGE